MLLLTFLLQNNKMYLLENKKPISKTCKIFGINVQNLCNPNMPFYHKKKFLHLMWVKG